MANHTALNGLETRLWSAADELRANSKLKASEYSVPVLGLIFLRYADFRFKQADKLLKAQGASGPGRSARSTTRRAACSTCPRHTTG